MTRNVTVDGEGQPQRFSVWGAKVLALIGSLPATLKDRSITVSMARRMEHEAVESLSQVSIDDELEPYAMQAARWSEDNFDELKALTPDRPEGLSDRAWDNWRPLFAIANAAGGNWPKRVRLACRQLTGVQDEPEDTVLLLTDLRALFSGDKREVWATTEVLDRLTEIEERPWRDWRYGRPLSPRQLAGLLKPFGIRPKGFREAYSVFRGYATEDFENAFARYIP